MRSEKISFVRVSCLVPDLTFFYVFPFLSMFFFFFFFRALIRRPWQKNNKKTKGNDDKGKLVPPPGQLSLLGFLQTAKVRYQTFSSTSAG